MKDVPQRRTKGTTLPDLDSWPLRRRGVRLTPPGPQRLRLPLSFQKLANCIRWNSGGWVTDQAGHPKFCSQDLAQGLGPLHTHIPRRDPKARAHLSAPRNSQQSPPPPPSLLWPFIPPCLACCFLSRGETWELSLEITTDCLAADTVMRWEKGAVLARGTDTHLAFHQSLPPHCPPPGTVGQMCSHRNHNGCFWKQSGRVCLEQQFSKCWLWTPWGSLRPSEGVYKVKTIFIVDPRCYLSFSLSSSG